MRKNFASVSRWNFPQLAGLALAVAPSRNISDHIRPVLETPPRAETAGTRNVPLSHNALLPYYLSLLEQDHENDPCLSNACRISES